MSMLILLAGSLIWLLFSPLPTWRLPVSVVLGLMVLAWTVGVLHINMRMKL